MSPTRRRTTVVLILLAAVAAVVAAMAGGVLSWPGTADDATTAGAGQTDTSVSGQSAAASSEPYRIEAEPSEVATDEPAPATGGRVQVVMTYVNFDTASGTVQGNGFAAGVIEDGGTCTLTLTRGSQKVMTTSTAVADAATSTCGLIETRTGLESGTWKAVLSYSSNRAEGVSDAVEVEVP